jgi:metallo-beta-lactamase family protein
MKLTFWGACRTVTGSMHEVAVNGRRYLMDCGLYQGRRKESFERNSNLPFYGSQIDAVVLSHAHIDHTGNLPTLAKQGFSGPIYGTSPTIDLANAMLADSAYLQEKDAAFLNKRRSRRKSLGVEDEAEAVQPLYSIADAERACQQMQPFELGHEFEVGPGLKCRSYEAGHMLGSASLVMEADGVRLAFSGDVGRKNLPIIPDPADLPPVDYLIMESTYGNRLHQPLGAVAEKLAEIIRRTAARGGRIIVPAFAVGRTQQLVLLMHELVNKQAIPSIPVYVDSPLAVNVTDIFRKYGNYFDEETRKFLDDGDDPFGFKRLTYVRDVEQSKALNDLRGPMVIISASGMCEAGRILHHLRNNISDPRNTVLITGFQAEHTLGRKIVDKLPEVPIFGEPIRLRAEVAKLNELSGHADQHELLAWMRPFVKTVKRVFLVHGEPSAAEAMATAVHDTYGVPVTVPSRGDSFVLA